MLNRSYPTSKAVVLAAEGAVRTGGGNASHEDEWVYRVTPAGRAALARWQTAHSPKPADNTRPVSMWR